MILRIRPKPRSDWMSAAHRGWAPLLYAMAAAGRSLAGIVLTAVLVSACLGATSRLPAAPVAPITKAKRLCLDTPLIRDGASCAVIYHPPSAEYEAAARELSGQLQERFGVRLAVKPDDEQRTWRSEKQNILALGHLGNSLLLRWLHFRSFFAPLPEMSRLLRTVHDPWGEGRNVVVLGGVDLASTKANFPRLLELLEANASGEVSLPPAFDPRPPLAADIQKQIDEYRRDLPELPLNYPAYVAGWVCSQYPKLGRDELVPLYRDCIQRLSDAQSYVHLYLFRECVNWDVIEESPSLTDADRLMITNFFRDSVADDEEGIGMLRSILRGKKLIQGNHPSQAACGIMAVADYLRKSLSQRSTRPVASRCGRLLRALSHEGLLPRRRRIHAELFDHEHPARGLANGGRTGQAPVPAPGARPPHSQLQ